MSVYVPAVYILCVCAEQLAQQHYLGLSLSVANREQPLNCQRNVTAACL